MEKTTEKDTASNTKPHAYVAPVEESSETQELMGPEEWDSLLVDSSLETDTRTAAATTTRDGAPALPGEDIWEKLSSTRWVKKKSLASHGNASTVADH